MLASVVHDPAPPKSGYFAVVILRNGSIDSSVCTQIPLLKIKIPTGFCDARGSTGNLSKVCCAISVAAAGAEENFGTLSVWANLVHEALLPGFTDLPAASFIHMRRVHLGFLSLSLYLHDGRKGRCRRHASSGMGKVRSVNPGWLAKMETIRIEVDGSGPVSGLLMNPAASRTCFIFAHGAGAGMTHSFMESVAPGLYARGVATLRYQFPYMEKGSKRPDAPVTARATVRAAVAEAARRCKGLRLVAGGKSFGGRMTSQAQAQAPLPGVRGLAFLGFPLHPAGKPSEDRAEHLAGIEIPMLFLQGTRDNLAERPLVEHVMERLGTKASLTWLEHADHSFHVPVRSGRNDRDVMREVLDTLATWMAALPHEP